MQDWEYVTLTLHDANGVTRNEAKMNYLGERGWELVAVTRYTNEHIAYFKRPKASK